MPDADDDEEDVSCAVCTRQLPEQFVDVHSAYRDPRDGYMKCPGCQLLPVPGTPNGAPSPTLGEDFVVQEKVEVEVHASYCGTATGWVGVYGQDEASTVKGHEREDVNDLVSDALDNGEVLHVDYKTVNGTGETRRVTLDGEPFDDEAWARQQVTNVPKDDLPLPDDQTTLEEVVA